MLNSAKLIELAEAVADGSEPDWEAAESSAQDEAERALIRQLRAASRIGAVRAMLYTSSLTSDESPQTVISAGATWGTLRILEKVGRGHFGDVYRAWDPALDREVALKVLRRRSTRTASGDEDVIEEGRLMARVRHPNVVTIFGAQKVNGVTGLWMEFVHGRTLEAELAQGGPFPAEQLTRVGVELCHALSAVHNAGLIHRDVKAQNVLRESTGRIVLGDFGTGRELDPDGSGGEELAGTPVYVAPEVFDGQAATARADIYGLGVLLFHLATGSYPVVGRNLAELRRRHAERQRRPLRELRADLPAPLLAAIDRAIEPEPGNRFDTAAAMASALTASPHGEDNTPRWTRRRLTAASALAAVLLVAAVALWQRDAFPWPRTTAPAATSAMPAAARGDRAVWRGLHVDLFGTISPDGRYLTYTDWYTTNNIMLRDLEAGTARPLTDNERFADRGAAGYSVISRDGNQVAYEWRPRDRADEIRIVSLRAAGLPAPRVLRQAADPRESIRPYDWSPDGRWIVAAGQQRGEFASTIEVIATADGTTRTLKSVPRDVNRIVFSPDGRYVAYDQTVDDLESRSKIFVLSVDGTRDEVLIDDDSDNRVMGWAADGHLVFGSDRTGAMALWILPTLDGRAAGSPRLVKENLQSTWSEGMTKDGALYVWTRTSPAYLTVAPIDLQNGTIDNANSAFSYPITSRGRPTWSPNGEYLAFISCRESGVGPCKVFLRTTRTNTARHVPNQMRFSFQLQPSDDGRRILAVGNDVNRRRGLYSIDTESGTTTLVAPFPDNATLADPRWSRDGRWIVYREINSTHVVLWRQQLASATRAVLARLPVTSLHQSRVLSLSPDERRLAYLRQNEDGATSSLVIQDLDDRAARVVLTDQTNRLDMYWHWLPDGSGFVVHKRNPEELWLVRLDGTARRMNVDLSQWEVEEPYALHPSRQAIAFVRTAGDAGSEIVALENILPARNAAAAASGPVAAASPPPGGR